MFDRYAVFSTHARERIREFQMSLAKANWLLYTATEDSLDAGMSKYKKEKYQERARYFRNGSILFTLLPRTEKVTNEPIYLVVSVYDQRMDLK